MILKHSRTLKKSLRLLALGALALAAAALMVAQSSTVSTLLSRARAQEQTGHLDLAEQTWRQVLLVDAKDVEAIAGLARAAKLAGKDAEARSYLDRLRQLNPQSPEIARIEATGSARPQTDQLQRAAQLAKTGHPADALQLYRSVWGSRPPDGDWALAYYDTEASIEADREDAVAGLRALAKRYPADPRYSITLGRILTYTPRSRAEGLRLLAQFPQDQAARAAAQQAQLWDAQRLETPTATPSKPAQADQGIARGAAESEAFSALAAGRVEDAHQRFLALQAEQPDNPRVLAGLGFLSMKQGDFKAATPLFEQAQQNGLHRRDLDEALQTSRFWATMQQGTEALKANRLDESVTAFKAALVLRPNAIDALNGLSGAYRRAGDPAQAIPVYRQMLKLQPRSTDAWLGLFTAQVQASQVSDALDTSQRMPAAIKTALQRNSDYLRSLASAYAANGQAQEAQAAIDHALALPLPASSSTEARIQRAALLAETRRFADAARLYRDILYDDPESLPAWQGLITLQHQTNHDAEALATVERMAPATYDAALDDSGFLSMMASLYQQQNRLELAQALLQRATRSYAAKGQPAPVALQIQTASISLQRNQPEQAYALFREVLAHSPDRAEAWKGLISALHQTHRDREALAELRIVPVAARRELDRDIDYQQTVAGIYAATGNPSAALQLIAQIQAHYRAVHGSAPAEIDIQNAWLLYNTHDDRDLYRALMGLGGRDDLTDDQRRTVQTIWATWSVRRAGESVDAGNAKRSVEILSAAYQAFPENPDVVKALAGGYLKGGDPKRAMALFSALHLANPSAADFQTMVAAAIAAPNLRQAELWLRDALDRFPNDPQVLATAARFEQARGDHTRAAAYWKASLAAMPPVDTANRLAHTLDHADAAPLQPRQSTGLSSLLDPDAAPDALARRPALPSYGETYATSRIPLTHVPASTESVYGPDPYLQQAAPVQLGGGSVAPAPVDDAEAFAPPGLFADRPRTDAAPEARVPVSAAIDAAAPAPVFTPEPGPPAAYKPNAAIHLLRSPSTERPPRAPVPSTAASGQTFSLHPQNYVLAQETTTWAAATQPDLPLQASRADTQLEPQSLPPLRGAWGIQPPAHQTDARSETETQLALLDAGYSPWRGGTGYVSHRSGTAGFDQLTLLEAPFETSTTLGGTTRLTAIVTPSFLDSGVSDGSSTDQLGTLAVGTIAAQQNSSGVAGEVQLSTSNLDLSLGTTPRGFLVPNITGRVSIHAPASPFKLTFAREGIKDSQLSYAGLRDPGSISTTYAGNLWGGVVSNAGNVQYSRGDDASGYYAGVGGQYITGLNVQTNNRFDGVAGAYWKLVKVPDSGELTVGANFFGMRYAHNLRYFTYGQGGYFSPSIYFLANLPFTFKGQYGSNVHYSIAGAVGLQAFQEDSSLYYPLHIYKATTTMTANVTSSPTAIDPLLGRPVLPIVPVQPVTPFSNPSYPTQSVVGGNYDLHAEVSDRILDRWYIGGFLNLNNTRDYASQTVGFFIRYMLRPQDLTDGAPTGLLPYQGPRPLLVP